MQHVQDLYEISRDPAIWRYLVESGFEFQELEAYISTAIENRKVNTEYPFIVFDKITKKYAGTTRLYEYSEVLKNIKLGHTWYGKEFRGSGLNKRCKFLLFNFVFDTLELERIGFGVHEFNKLSIWALESIGCTMEGKLRSFVVLPNESDRADILLFSLLKNEWHNEIKELLINKINSKC